MQFADRVSLLPVICTINAFSKSNSFETRRDTYAKVLATGAAVRVDARDAATAEFSSWRATHVDLDAMLTGSMMTKDGKDEGKW